MQGSLPLQWMQVGTVNVDFTKENAFIDAIDGEISIQFSEAWKALPRTSQSMTKRGAGRNT